MQVLAFIKDLVLGTKIRAHCGEKGHDYTSARDIEKFTAELIKNPTVVLVDLDIQGADPFAAIETAKKANSRILCFYSHVNPELATKAEELGIKDVYRRSKFFTDLQNIL